MLLTQLSRRGASCKVNWLRCYLTFIPVEDTVFTWSHKARSGTLEYSTNNGRTWITIADGESTPTITAGSKVIWRGNMLPTTNSSTDTGGIGTFSSTGMFGAYGNIQSLLFSDAFYNTQLSSSYNYAYSGLFYNCTKLIVAPELPATTLVDYCYYQMFNGCTSLITAPELPAIILTPSCYAQMFQDCTSLTIAPELPATTLTVLCYQRMFYGCTSLTTAPALPATTLADRCYYFMFYRCTSLITAPELPATTLAVLCYQYMFYGCTSLTSAPELPATSLASSCYAYMFTMCSSLTSAPELPATTLISQCYYAMFYGCGKLNYIKCLATDISASNCTTNWVRNVASNGTFIKASEMSDWGSGTSGIPANWTVQDDI